jgi:glycerol-3-phosphate dehydrogenase (NAD(P)+)
LQAQARRVSILGAGSFGTAIAVALARGDQEIALFCRTEAQAQNIFRSGQNAAYFPGHQLSSKIKPVSRLEGCLEADVIFLAFPARHMDDYAHLLGEAAASRAVIVNLVKGLHQEHFVFANLFQRHASRLEYVALKGPTFARPLLLGEWSGFTCGSSSDAAAGVITELFRPAAIHFDYSSSPEAVDAVSAIKNVYAIYFGMAASLGLSDNSRFMLISRIISEIREIIAQLGYSPDVLFKYCGLGDILLTGFCDNSRNRTLGVMIGRQIPIDFARSGFVIEGVRSVRILLSKIGEHPAPFLHLLVEILEGRVLPIRMLEMAGFR